MRLKIFFFPFSLIVSIILFVWFIGPEFSAIKNKISELNSEEKSLQEIINKKQNLNNLEASLESNGDREELVLSYLPFTKKEDEIVHTLDYLAIGSGISLLNLTIADVKVDKISASPSISSTGLATPEEVLKEKGAVKIIGVELSLAGSYEGINDFLEQIYRTRIANNVYFANIYKQPESDNLMANIKINFSYLPQIHLDINEGLSDPIFSQKSFNLAIIDDLNNLINEKIPGIETSSVGKANPFLP